MKLVDNSDLEGNEFVQFNNGIGGFLGDIQNDIHNYPAGGGGGGGTITIGGGSTVVLTNAPNTALSNEKRTLVIKSDVPSAYVYINDENTQKSTPTTIDVTISDLLLNGDKKITLEKVGYKTNDTYIVSLTKNEEFEPDLQNYLGNFNPMSSLFGGMSGNSGISGLGQAWLDGYPTFNQKSQVYSTKSYYKINIKHYANGYEQTDVLSFDDALNFTLNKEVIKVDPPIDTTNTLSINLNGENSSVILNVTKIDGSAELINLTKGDNTILLQLGSTVNIQSSTISKFRLTNIKVNADGYNSNEINAQTNLESISTKLNIDGKNYLINVTSEPFITKVLNTPSISLINQNTKKLYNINSKADVPIGLTKSLNTSKITLYVDNQQFTFSNLDAITDSNFIATIPARVFNRIGNYKVKLVPSNSDGDGSINELTIDATDDIYVGVPDIRNITYPSILNGPDFVGTNVDFGISYESVNTDYVKIYKLGSDQFIKATKSGVVSLNFQSLLNIGGVSAPQDVDTITLTLKLVPYNESGREIVIGKEELIDIKFNKGKLTIPRDVAVGRIADGFIDQFDTSIFADETSKYLTHLLNLGNGDNKVITTWVGSEGSLILKLYEPLDTAVQLMGLMKHLVIH